MRILSKHYLCFAFVVTTIILQGSRAFAELRAGDTVIAKEATDLKLSGKVVGKVRAGDLLLVGEVRGAWVNVGGKKPGWVHADNLLRDAAAIEQLSTQIENEPSAARLLARARI